MKRWSAVLPIAFIAVSSVLIARQEPASPAKTVWDGIYTQEQATRGQKEYMDTCSRCHGVQLQGTEGNGLTGKDFMERWREDNVGSLYEFVTENMPPVRRGAGRVLIPTETYLDILSFVMSQNGFPAGLTALTEEGLDDIRIQYKDGPRPIPNGALVWVAGCFQGADATWTLSGASDPMRTRNNETKDYTEFHAAETNPLGKETYRLTNLGMLSTFKPEAHKGQELLVKGNLIRPADPDSKDPMRITVTAYRKVDDTCKQ